MKINETSPTINTLSTSWYDLLKRRREDNGEHACIVSRFLDVTKILISKNFTTLRANRAEPDIILTWKKDEDKS